MNFIIDQYDKKKSRFDKVLLEIFLVKLINIYIYLFIPATSYTPLSCHGQTEAQRTDRHTDR